MTQYLVVFTRQKNEKTNPYSIVDETTLNRLKNLPSPLPVKPNQKLVKSYMEIAEDLYSKEDLERMVALL